MRDVSQRLRRLLYIVPHVARQPDGVDVGDLADLLGVTRDQMMARHQANHIQVAYATDARSAGRDSCSRARSACMACRCRHSSTRTRQPSPR